MHPSAENEMRRKRWFRRENKAAGAHSQHWGQQQLCPQVAERGAAHPGCEAWWFTVLQLQRFPWISSWFLVPFVRWQVSFHFYLSSQLVLHWKFDGEQRLHTEVPFQEDSQCRSLLSVKYWELQHSLALGKWNEWAQFPTPAGNSETGCLGELEATSLDVHGNFPLSATHSYLLSAEREDEHTASTPPWRCGQGRPHLFVLLLYVYCSPPHPISPQEPCRTTTCHSLLSNTSVQSKLYTSAWAERGREASGSRAVLN